jgi:hypothetical protein
MLDRQILRIEERPIKHKLFLPQELVQREVWIRGLHKRPNYRQ